MIRALLPATVTSTLVVAVLYTSNYFVPIKSGLSYAGPPRAVTSVRFLADVSWQQADGTRRVEQSLFDEALGMIRDARRFILLDMFLFNDMQGPVPERTRALSSELTQALIAQQSQHPQMQITVITDPINTVYGGYQNPQLKSLTEAGIDVVLTDLTRLRNSNPVYSFFWHWLIRPWGNQQMGEALPNPFGAGRVSLRSYLALFNFKANHRKLLLVDSPSAAGAAYSALLMSANPHDGSSAHRNVGLRFSGAATLDVLAAENAVLALSGHKELALPMPAAEPPGQASLQVLTEGQIKQAILALLDSAGAGDHLRLLLFYLSEREVIAAIKAARARGAQVQVILDVNQDAFGHRKNGIPNKPVAEELVEADVELRWCDTSGEQCHAKMLLLESGSGMALLQGSANFTRRNLDDFNLEADVLLRASTPIDPLREAREHFDAMWNNDHERSYTVAFDTHRDDSLLLKLLYRFMEASGLSTF